MLADRMRMGGYKGGCDDISGSPGECKLIAGNMEQGYFGFVTANDFITGDVLASSIGLSAGISQFSNEGWFKWVEDNKIIFTAKKTFRHSISWNSINDMGAVFGSKIVMIGGLTYKVRLLTDSEWGVIIHGVLTKMNPQWDYYSDEDLHFISGENGNASWIQDFAGDETNRRWKRSNAGGWIDPSSSLSFLGWRPALELVI